MKVYYLNINNTLKKLIIVLLVLSAVLLIFNIVQSDLIRSTTSSLEPIYQGKAGGKKIALTCNVVWGEEYVPQMLEILKRNNVKMTFYMGGKWVKDFPDLTNQIAKDHELGNHSYSHPHPTFISKQENINEIKKTEDEIYRLTKQKTRLYAPPYGEFNQTVLEAADELGYKTLMWSIDTRDWQRPAPEEIVRRVCDKAHSGAIVLMHPTQPTVEALPVIIENLKKQGYQLTTVSDVLGLNLN